MTNENPLANWDSAYQAVVDALDYLDGMIDADNGVPNKEMRLHMTLSDALDYLLVMNPSLFGKLKPTTKWKRESV